MSWYAVDAVSDAIDEAKTLLLPFDLRRWVTLAVVTFFVGGTGGSPSLNQTVDDPRTITRLPETIYGVEFWSFVALVVLAAVAVGLLFLVLGSVMEFVFVDALRRRDVRIRGRFGRRLSVGLRLAGFRLLVLLAGLLVVGLVLLPVVAATAMAMPLAFLALFVTIPLALVLGLVLVLVQEFTTAFVVPVVCDTGAGIFATWRTTVWPGVRREWQQFLLFAVLKFGISLVVGFAVSVLLGIVFLPVFLLVGVGVFTAGASTASLAIAGLFALVLLAATLVFVRMPIAVFVRYYSLCVLDTSEIAWTMRDDDAPDVATAA